MKRSFIISCLMLAGIACMSAMKAGDVQHRGFFNQDSLRLLNKYERCSYYFTLLNVAAYNERIAPVHPELLIMPHVQVAGDSLCRPSYTFDGKQMTLDERFYRAYPIQADYQLSVEREGHSGRFIRLWLKNLIYPGREVRYDADTLDVSLYKDPQYRLRASDPKTLTWKVYDHSAGDTAIAREYDQQNLVLKTVCYVSKGIKTDTFEIYDPVNNTTQLVLSDRRMYVGTGNSARSLK